MTFKKGHDPNRLSAFGHGIMKYRQHVSDLLAEGSPEAAQYIIETMRNEKNSANLRFAAAQDIMNRGIGKPADVVVTASINADKLNDLSTMSDSELQRVINGASPVDSDGIEVKDVN